MNPDACSRHAELGFVYTVLGCRDCYPGPMTPETPRTRDALREASEGAAGERVHKLLAADGLVCQGTHHLGLATCQGIAAALASTEEAPLDVARRGICPVCHNLFREAGHAFDCPLAAYQRRRPESGR